MGFFGRGLRGRGGEFEVVGHKALPDAEHVAERAQRAGERGTGFGEFLDLLVVVQDVDQKADRHGAGVHVGAGARVILQQAVDAVAEAADAEVHVQAELPGNHHVVASGGQEQRRDEDRKASG